MVDSKQNKNSSILHSCLNEWIYDLEKYTAGKSFQEVIDEHGFLESEIIKLASNETTLGTSPKAIEAAVAAASTSNYYDDARSEGLVNTLTERFAKQGLDMDKVGVVVGNGLDNIIEHVGRLAITKNSSIVTMPPTFIYYKLIAEWRGADVINVPRDYSDFSFDPDKVLSMVREDTSVVFLCSPNNPTGNVHDVETIEYLAKNLNCLLFIDHAYIEFTDPKHDAKWLVEKYPNLIVGYTFSKAYAMAGYRVGYALMSKELWEQYHKVLTPYTCSRVSMAAAKAALEDEEHLQKIVKACNEGKKLYYTGLDELGFEYKKSETNFILMRNKKDTGEQLLNELLKKAIVVRPMPIVCKYCIRVTVGTEEQNQRVLEALAEFRRDNA